MEMWEVFFAFHISKTHCDAELTRSSVVKASYEAARNGIRDAAARFHVAKVFQS